MYNLFFFLPNLFLIIFVFFYTSYPHLFLPVFDQVHLERVKLVGQSGLNLFCPLKSHLNRPGGRNSKSCPLNSPRRLGLLRLVTLLNKKIPHISVRDNKFLKVLTSTNIFKDFFNTKEQTIGFCFTISFYFVVTLTM